MTDIAERNARVAMFSRIEKDVFPGAEKLAAGIASFTVEGVEFGSRPPQRAFGADGELRFDVGRWNGSRFERIPGRVLFPIRPPVMDVQYPEGVFLVPSLTSVYVHYTPVTRRLDYFEVWNYFSLVNANETDIRQKAFGLLESRIAKKYPEEKIWTSVRYVRHSDFHAVVTEVAARKFAAAGEAERRAIENF